MHSHFTNRQRENCQNHPECGWSPTPGWAELCIRFSALQRHNLQTSHQSLEKIQGYSGKWFGTSLSSSPG